MSTGNKMSMTYEAEKEKHVPEIFVLTFSNNTEKKYRTCAI
jgi:hypothetical protein